MMGEGVSLSNVYEVEVAEYLREAGDDGAVASCIVVQLKEGRGHQLVVPGHGEQGLLGQGHQE